MRSEVLLLSSLLYLIMYTSMGISVFGKDQNGGLEKAKEVALTKQLNFVLVQTFTKSYYFSISSFCDYMYIY